MPGEAYTSSVQDVLFVNCSLALMLSATLRSSNGDTGRTLLSLEAMHPIVVCEKLCESIMLYLL